MNGTGTDTMWRCARIFTRLKVQVQAYAPTKYRSKATDQPAGITLSRSPVTSGTNVPRLRREAKILVGNKKNFRSFQASDPLRDERSTTRTIKSLNITKKENFIYIDITADGFLYKMVRNIVGTLLDIVSKRKPEGSMRAILKSRDRTSAGPTAPAHGLCLKEVKY